MDDELSQLLDDVLDDLAQAGEGMLLAVAAAYQPDTPEHLEAWGDLDRAIEAADAADSVGEVRARVANWASMGAHVTGGHLGAGWAAEPVHEARMRVGRALVDYLLAYLFREQLLAESFRALVAPWGLVDDDAEDGDGAEGEPGAGPDAPSA
jgi:hypothetical protein